ncbi:MAG: glycosyltransferase, partial [Bacteroidia bacterium]|nr:glycosyltransferase [Bacteroidia bacterium]
MHVVVIPTVATLQGKLKREKLLKRALDSIANQSSQPDKLIIAIDHEGIDPAHQDIPREAILSLLPESLQEITSLIYNRRTPGLGGALNTALMELISLDKENEDSLWVAVLDDDDWWEPSYLEEVKRVIHKESPDWIAAAFRRYSENEPTLHHPPFSLEDFFPALLFTNPDIEGSTLSFRLSKWIEAGGFEETKATSDRDFALKLFLIGAKYAPLSTPLVNIDAYEQRERVSNPKSPQKRQNIAAFWRKYRHLMYKEEEAALFQRAERFFGIEQTAIEQTPIEVLPSLGASSPKESVSLPTHSYSRLPYLLVGIVSDSNAAGKARVEPLLQDLSELATHPALGRMEVIVVENWHEDDSLEQLIRQTNAKGLWCYFVSVKEQEKAAAEGRLGQGFVRRSGRLSVAESRRILQAYMYPLLQAQPGGIGWILDDDMRLYGLRWTPEGWKRYPIDYISLFLQLQQTDADVVIGKYAGAPPCKVEGTLRTQLLDLFYLTLIALRQPSDYPLASLYEEITQYLPTLPDYYYDWSTRHHWHLEWCFFMPPAPAPSTIKEALHYLLENLERFLHQGAPLTRPVAYIGIDLSEPFLIPSHLRGGNTLVINPETLRILQPVLQNTPVLPTRSDMLWTLHLKEQGFRIYMSSNLITTQERFLSTILSSDILWQDAWGHAIVAAPNSKQVSIKLKYRLQEMLFSLGRSQGLVRSIRQVLSKPEFHAKYPSLMPLIGKAQSLLAELERQITQSKSDLRRRYQQFRFQNEKSLSAAEIFTFPSAESLPQVEDYPQIPTTEKERLALLHTQRILSLSKAPEVLGAGDEGVVMRHAGKIYKYFYQMPSEIARQHKEVINTLRLPEKLTRLRTMKLIQAPKGHLLGYTEDVGIHPYRAVSPEEWIALAEECKRTRCIISNPKPENLGVIPATNRLVFIDYGNGIWDYTEKDWQIMLRRFWLIWRWTGWLSSPEGHAFLRRLLTLSITQSFPELEGWEYLERVLSLPSPTHQLRQRIAEILHGTPADKILDYGCGKGELVNDLRRMGKMAYGYDMSYYPNWLRYEDNSTFLTSDPLMLEQWGQFDVIVSARVICTLSDTHVLEYLGAIRSFLREGGVVILALCNPFSLQAGRHLHQARYLPQPLREEKPLIWEKGVFTTLENTSLEIRRIDVYRPWHYLKHLLLRGGFVIERIEGETESILANRLEPFSDYLILKLRPAPSPWPVSLVIRASAMEWKTLYDSVVHLVSHLEQPRAFGEIIAVLDNKRQSFVRSYTEPNYENAYQALKRLQEEGWIDAILEVPSEESFLRDLNQRWWNRDTPDTHTAEGIPVAASLLAFEKACYPYVLHIDSDILVYRRNYQDDYLQKMIDYLEREGTICVSLSIPTEVDGRWSSHHPDGTPYRVEVRAGLFHRDRILALRPLPIIVPEGLPKFYRALDAVVQQRNLFVWRYKDSHTFYLHLPNSLKQNRRLWHLIWDRVEKGYIPPSGFEKAEIPPEPEAALLTQWMGPKRKEEVVVVT